MKLIYAMCVLLALAACGGTTSLMDTSGRNLLKAEKVYVLTNLHPDPAKAKLYSINYQQDGLIPMCAEVEIVELSRKRLVFKELDTGITYNYDHHKAAGEFTEHLKDYFGSTCDIGKIAKLSKLDRKGIEEGKVFEGMTKEGVVYAIGYPPKHRTPSLDNNMWTYWRNRFNTMAVEFDANGKVKAIVN